MSRESARPHLRREIGAGGAFLLAFNGVLGGAIFALPAVLATDFGTFSPWLFPIVALGTLAIAVPFARTAAAFPDNGGPALYGAVFGRFVGFELGWVYYVARLVAFAANANVVTDYLARWWSPADEGVARAAILVAICAGFAAVNIAGVRKALGLLTGLTVLKVLPLLVAAIAAILISLPLPPPGQPPPLSEFEAGMLLVFYAFVGFENAVVPAGETKRPQRALPVGIFVTLGTTTLLYFLVQLAFVAALPGGGADETAPLIDLGAWLAGPAGAAILTLAALLSLAGNLHGNMTATARVTFGLAERGDLPSWFARVHPRFVTPHTSIAFFAAASAALALIGSYVWLAVISALARLFVYGVTIAALPRIPGRRAGASSYAMAAAGIALCVWAAAQATADAWRTLGLLAVAGAILFFAARVASRSRPG